MTREQAIALYDTGFWKDLSYEQRFRFQINEPLLCIMPFDVFRESAEKALGRPVWTHEFVDFNGLWREYAGDNPRPTMQEIIDMIPPEKRIVICLDAGPGGA